MNPYLSGALQTIHTGIGWFVLAIVLVAGIYFLPDTWKKYLRYTFYAILVLAASLAILGAGALFIGTLICGGFCQMG